MDKTGYYPYSHENYHGPSYFYLAKGITKLLGYEELPLRLSAVVPGVLSIVLLLVLRRQLGDLFVLLAAALLTFSSSHLFYSRYAIHEPFFLLGGAALAFSLYLWMTQGKVRYFFLGAVGLALLVTIKETFIITLFCLFWATLVAWLPRHFFIRVWKQEWILISLLLISCGCVAFALRGAPVGADPVISMGQRAPLALAMIGAVLALSTVVYTLRLLRQPVELAPAGRLLILAVLSAGFYVLTDKSAKGAVAVSGIFFCTTALLSVLQSRLDIFNRYLSQRSALGYAGILAALIVLASFSGGFIWAGGLSEALHAVPQWVGRNESDVGHHKPFGYYAAIITGIKATLDAALQPALDVTLGTEPHLLLSLIIPALLAGGAVFLIATRRGDTLDEALPRGDRLFLSFTLVWALAAFFVYSFVKYKTPWLIINITYPAVLVLAWCLTKLFSAELGGRALGALCAAIICTGAVYTSYVYTFLVPYGSNNPFSYVHTTAGMLYSVNDIQAHWKRRPDAKILVAVNGYWPLPYYLRNKKEQVHYLTTDRPQDYANSYEVMLMEKEVMWDAEGWARKYYRLSDVEETNAYLKR